MDTPREHLGDETVRLRRWRPSDVDMLHELVRSSVEHLRPWIPWVADGEYPRAEAVRYVADRDRDWAADVQYAYLVRSAAGEPVGAVSLHNRIGPHGLEIGYWLAATATGRGWATAAVRLVTAEAFRVGARLVEIHHDEGNAPSGAVPRRLGFTRVGTVPASRPSPGGTGTNVVWRLDRDT